ncbi:MAG TPA: AraC family transcriptional regulator [bacterium]|nr:AraC family transcriptional regulator [bacterium]
MPLHAHHSLIIGWQLRGRRILLLGRRPVAIPAGMPYVIGPGLLHGSRPVDDAAFRARLILLTPCRAPAGMHFPLQSPHYARLLPLLQGVRTGRLAPAAVRGFWRILRAAGCAAPGVTDRRLQAARQLLMTDLDRPRTVAAVARAVGLSRYHFIRAFAAGFGVTPHAYRTIMRVQQAKQFMMDGLTPVACAYQCGFADQSHLHRHFRRQVGVTPARYWPRRP